MKALVNLDVKLLRLSIWITLGAALLFLPVQHFFVPPATRPMVYAALGFTLVYTGVLFLGFHLKKYRLTAIAFVFFHLITDSFAISAHPDNLLIYAFLLVFLFIFIFNILLVRWPEVIGSDVVLLAGVLVYMLWPVTGFLGALREWNVDPGFGVGAIFVFFSLLALLGTAAIETIRRKEEKLIIINANLHRLVAEQVNKIIQSDKEKRAYQEQVESILRHIPVGVVIVDRELNVLYSNGVHIKEARAQGPDNDDQESILPQDVLKSDLLKAKFDLALSSQKKLVGQHFTHVGKNDQTRIIRYSYVPVNLDPDDQHLKLVLITEDITQEENMREKLMRTEHMAEMGKMAANLAHEVNNPLAGIKLYLELLEQGIEDDGKRKRIFTILDTSIARIDKIIKGFLTFSRQEKARKDQINLAAVMKETLDIAVGFKPLHHIDIDINLSKDLPFVAADRYKMGQVFLNLINNAKDAMPQGGRLQISARREEDHIVLVFADNGMGIKKEDVPHVFTPFYTTKERGHGTGLGLSTCYGIIQDHGGTIDVSSREGVGTTFTIKIPIVLTKKGLFHG